MFDVVVIGGGVVGAMILRALSRYHLDVCLLEKAEDVAMGQSKANSGIVHAGFDAVSGSLKAKFNVLGSEMMEKVALDLGVEYKNNGALVVAFSEEQIKTLYELKARGEANGVKDLYILDKAELKEKEKNISDDAVGALYAKTSAIVCPYKLTIAGIGNAMDNGAKLKLGFEVSLIQKDDDGFTIYSADGTSVKAKVIINCAGIGSQKIANMLGDYSFKIGGRKGEYILLDKESAGFVKHTLFFTPTEKGKGILITPTVDNNVLLGPTAKVIENGSVGTTQSGLNEVSEKARIMCKNPPLYNTITSFAGTRAFSDRNDFIIEQSPVCKNLINCAGIESPGLTASPAIAEYVVKELLGKILTLKEKEDYIKTRKPDNFFEKLTTEQKNELIKEDGRYGKIVCRCERITEGEIVRAIKTNPPALNVDAIKRRTRSGMGRCQGGFCQPQIAEIIARELNIPLLSVTKHGKGSELLTGRSK